MAVAKLPFSGVKQAFPITADPRWPRRLGACLLVIGSAWAAPLGKFSGLTVTGDRILGLTALAVLGAIVVVERLHWTAVHTALAVFVGVQLLATSINARTWASGPKFVIVYLIGFACFALAVECAWSPDGRRWLTVAWIGIAAALSLVGTTSALLSNVYQYPFWGSGAAQPLFEDTSYARMLYAARASFNEWNLFSTFLLIPFALTLWSWRRDDGRHWRLAALIAIVLGLINGMTRIAWLLTLAIALLWWWTRRSRSRHVAVLAGAMVAIIAAALVLQTLSLGVLPIRARLFEHSSNLAHRMIINRVTIDSWLERPVSEPDARYSDDERATGPDFLGTARNVMLGHGAGSINRLSIVFPLVGRVHRIWNGNLVLFLLHDSGVLGLSALLGVVMLIGWRARHAMADGVDEETSTLIVSLLASGLALGVAYQFTHGLWLMYPYIYLGLLTAVLENAQPAQVSSGRLASTAAWSA